MATRKPTSPDSAGQGVDPHARTLLADETQDSAFDSILRELARAPESAEPGSAAELLVGSVIADRFEVVREIGRGGFAQVYEARDRVLSRAVAIKFLTRGRRLTGRGLELFYREAQATARLNHAHIVTAYDWGEWNGVPFLVLELLRGESLAARLERGPLDEERAWAIARDVAGALVYAHGQGVLHLDLKSQNIFLVEDGRVKVLDFGLAGLDWDEEVPGGVARVAGGTPATMAPEQSGRASATDGRTDVWAVGVVLHEMLFGRLPERLADGAAAAPLPPASRRAHKVLSRALVRDPDGRFPDAASLLVALEEASRPGVLRRRAWIVGAAVAAAGGVAAFGAWQIHRGQSGAGPAHSVPSASQHRQLTFTGDVFHADLSPAGDVFAYITNQRSELWVREVDSDQPRRIYVGKELDRPRWSLDGKTILIDSMTQPPIVWSIPIAGGGPQQVANRRNLHVVLHDGASLASVWTAHPVHQEVHIGPVTGGTTAELPLPKNLGIVDIDATSDRRFLLATYDGRGGHLWSVRSGSSAALLRDEDESIGGARWQGDGAGIFFVRGVGRDGSLRWIPVPTQPDTPAVTLFSGVELGDALSASRDGRRLLYHRQLSFANLIRLGPDGTLTPLTQGTAELGMAGISPEGRSIVYVAREDRSSSIVVGAIGPGAPTTRVFRCARRCASPQWSPDGSRIAFAREAPAGWQIAIIDAHGAGERILEHSRSTDGNGTSSLAWLSNRDVIYMPIRNEALHVVDVDTGRDQVFLQQQAPGWMFFPRVSPDGSRVAFAWNPGRLRKSGIFVADRAGKEAHRVFEGFANPIGWTDDGDTLLVATNRGGLATFDRIVKLDLQSGTRSDFFTPAADVHAIDGAGIPGTSDLILLQIEFKSDAWLIEDPLGPPAR